MLVTQMSLRTMMALKVLPRYEVTTGQDLLGFEYSALVRNLRVPKRDPY